MLTGSLYAAGARLGVQEVERETETLATSTLDTVRRRLGNPRILEDEVVALRRSGCLGQPCWIKLEAPKNA